MSSQCCRAIKQKQKRQVCRLSVTIGIKKKHNKVLVDAITLLLIAIVDFSWVSTS